MTTVGKPDPLAGGEVEWRFGVSRIHVAAEVH